MGQFEIKMEELYDNWIARISVEEKSFYQKSYELYSQREIKLKESLKGMNALRPFHLSFLEPDCAQQ
jgi:hypothetical protein